MDELTRIALIGTAKAAGTSSGEHPADVLLEGLTRDAEEALLLRAGERSVFEESGRAALSDVAAVPAAAADELACGSPRLTGLLQNALATDSKELLIEFLQQMQGCRLVLPHELLPQALSLSDSNVREHLLPVLGERGRWLAGFQADWAWVQSGVATLTDQNRDHLLSVWEHGAIRDRCSALTTMRKADAAEGRAALEETFAQEKADHRTRLLATLEHGLSSLDEPFLESCLDDRSTQVREAAANLLVRLPGSALSARMQERADAMLTLTTTGRLRKKPKLVCEPPEQIDKTWNRDGISSKAPTGRGKRAFWAETVLATVPPAHWASHFQLEPTALIAAMGDDSFEAAVLAAWSQAVARFANSDPESAAWLVPLWDRWAERAGRMTGQGHKEACGQLAVLLPVLPREQAEGAMLRLVEDARQGEATEALAMLSQLERPWSATFGDSYLKLVRKVLKRSADNHGYQWSNTLFTAGRAIPREVFAAALAPWDVNKKDEGSWHTRSIVRETEQFIEMIQTRRTFYEELAR